MEHLGCIGTQVHGDCNIRPWNGEGSCTRGGYPCIGCTEPQFGELDHPFLETPKRAGIPRGPADRHAQGVVRGAGLPRQGRHAGAPAQECRRRPHRRAAGRRSGKARQMSRHHRWALQPGRRRSRNPAGRPRTGGRARPRSIRRCIAASSRSCAARRPSDALVYAPRICGICSVSQSMAAATALAAAQGVTPPENGQLLQNLILAAENVADHLTHFYMFFMPDFARAVYAGEPWTRRSPARFKAMSGEATARVPAGARGVSACHGGDRRTLAAHAGPSAGWHDAGRRRQRSRRGCWPSSPALRRFLEERLFGCDTLERVTALDSAAALEAWAATGPARAGRFPAFPARVGGARAGPAWPRLRAVLSYGAYRLGGAAAFRRGVWEDGAVRALRQRGDREDHQLVLAGARRKGRAIRRAA